MLKFYFRTIPGRSIARQRAMAAEAGMVEKEAAPIYEESTKSFPEMRGNVIGSCRAGRKDVIWVSDLVVLAKDRKDLAATAKALAAKGIGILEGATGRRSESPHEAQLMTLDATNWWSNRNRPFTDSETASETGKRGAKASAKARRVGRMPKNLALPIWRDKTLTVPQAIEKINDDDTYPKPWTASTAYRTLGKREAFAGRPGRKS